MSGMPQEDLATVITLLNGNSDEAPSVEKIKIAVMLLLALNEFLVDTGRMANALEKLATHYENEIL